MLYYRLYFISPQSGHIERFAEYEAPDDAAAAALAAEHRGKAPLELWSGHRKVMHFEALSRRQPRAPRRRVAPPPPARLSGPTRRTAHMLACPALSQVMEFVAGLFHLPPSAPRLRTREVPRFFFHVHDDIDALDEEGRELPDLAAARDAAINGVRELACEQIRKGKVDLRHRIEVADDAGRTVLKITFGDAFAIEG